LKCEPKLDTKETETHVPYFPKTKVAFLHIVSLIYCYDKHKVLSKHIYGSENISFDWYVRSVKVYIFLKVQKKNQDFVEFRSTRPVSMIIVWKASS
jgi:hypothetical protein